MTGDSSLRAEAAWKSARQIVNLLPIEQVARLAQLRQEIIADARIARELAS